MATPLTLQIATKLRGYDDIFNALVSSVPPGSMYDFSRPIVAWTAEPTLFSLQTDVPDIPIQIYVLRVGEYHFGTDQGNLIEKIYVTPKNNSINFSISLGLGLNRIIAVEAVPNGRQAYLEVISTPNALIFEPLGEEIFVSGNKAQSVSDAIYSPYATRLLDQVIFFYELLPDFQALKVLSTKLLVRSQIHFPAKSIGTDNLIQAFSLNTPVYETQKESSEYKIEESRIQRSIQNQAGQEAHVWFPNLAVTRWLAFTKMSSSFSNNFVFVDVRDDLVEIVHKGKNQLHRFDFDDSGSSLLKALGITNNFSNIDMFMHFQVRINMSICVWSNTFDKYVMAPNLIGGERLLFDTGVFFDSGFPLDEDPIDPFTDGWEGWSLSGRFDNQPPLPLDSTVTPNRLWPGTLCSYSQGPYTQLMNTFRSDIDVSLDLLASGSMDTYVSPGVISEMGLEILSNGPLQAGIPVLSIAKFIDPNGMTLPTGTGSVVVEESSGGSTTLLSITTSGYQYFYLIPTAAGSATNWGIISGIYSGRSSSFEVLPGPFAGLVISPIMGQAVGVPFVVNIQAVDAFDNNVTDVGVNTKVTISGGGGFSSPTISPTYVDLINGFASVSVTMSEVESGFLVFKINAYVQDSDTFSVT